MTVVRWLMRPAGDVPDGDAWLAPDERRLQDALGDDALRRGWRLARWTAKSALRRCPGAVFAGQSPEALAILADASGMPALFRSGVRQACSLSVSQRADWALAVVGPAESRLGCDLALAAPAGAGANGAFTAAERRSIALAPPQERERLAARLWRVKESAARAVGAAVGTEAGAADVQLLLGDEEAGWRPLRVRRRGGPSLEGWWREDGGRVATVVASPAAAPPVRVVSPSRPWPAQHEPARTA